ncbi:MAG: hypothetical protein KIT25_13330 [Enhydrobacter sp.]|nr:MAG: hypothetical protein KIT25_13330 [Enhydrobacter sp.]
MSGRPDEPASGPASDPAVFAGANRVDGRRLRSERTRQLIIEAYMALVRENPQVPTASQIAERAGYSVRSVFERFPDLLALRVAAADYAIAEARTQSALRDVDADRPTRIRSQVESRAAGCERWLPLWRVLNADSAGAEELQKRIRLIRELIRLRLELMFRPELAGLSDGERRRMLLALEAITDFESWGRMRELYGLTIEEACAVWIRALDRLLPPTPAVS